MLKSGRVRRELRGIRGVSTTFGGLPRGEGQLVGANGDPQIVSGRHPAPGDVTFDPRTGDP